MKHFLNQHSIEYDKNIWNDTTIFELNLGDKLTFENGDFNITYDHPLKISEYKKGVYYAIFSIKEMEHKQWLVFYRVSSSELSDESKVYLVKQTDCDTLLRLVDKSLHIS